MNGAGTGVGEGGGKGGGGVGGSEGGVGRGESCAGDRHGAISSVDAGKIHTREQQRHGLVRSEEVEIEITV